MARALGWLALGGLVFLGVVLLVAPLEVAVRAFVLASLTVLPGLLMLAVAGAARRRRGGRVSTADHPPTDPGEA